MDPEGYSARNPSCIGASSVRQQKTAREALRPRMRELAVKGGVNFSLRHVQSRPFTCHNAANMFSELLYYVQRCWSAKKIGGGLQPAGF